MRLRNKPGAALAAALIPLLGAASLHAQALHAQVLDVQTPPPDLPQGEGPRGTSQAVPGQERYDEVGYASIEPVGGEGAVLAAHRSLAIGSFVEVTALDSGKTIAVMVAAAGPEAGGRLIALSPAAAKLIGVAGDTPAGVRVRLVQPNGPDQNALKNGRAGADRLDAPKPLLVALRKRLPADPPAVPAPRPTPTPVAKLAAPAPKRAPAPVPPPKATPPAPPAKPSLARTTPPAKATPPAKGGVYLQVAALSTEARAKALATSLGGVVTPAGKLYRVRTGPYPDAHAAQNARDALARRGYGSATIVSDH